MHTNYTVVESYRIWKFVLKYLSNAYVCVCVRERQREREKSGIAKSESSLRNRALKDEPKDKETLDLHQVSVHLQGVTGITQVHLDETHLKPAGIYPGPSSSSKERGFCRQIASLAGISNAAKRQYSVALRLSVGINLYYCYFFFFAVHSLSIYWLPFPSNHFPFFHLFVFPQSLAPTDVRSADVGREQSHRTGS